MKIYVIEERGGSYDTSYTIVLKQGFTTKEFAQEFIDELTEYDKFLEESGSLWNYIEDTLDKTIPEEYWEDNDNEIEIWSDSFDIFIKHLKEYMPEIHKSYSEKQLKALYEFYEFGDYIDGTPYYHIKEIEIIK
jgi:hypothetical protein